MELSYTSVILLHHTSFTIPRSLSTVPTLLEIKDNNPSIDPSLRQRPFLDERLMRLILVHIVVQILARRKFDDKANLHVVVECFLGDLSTAFDALWANSGTAV